MSKVLKGIVTNFFETGTEGLVWVFVEDGRPRSYENCHWLGAGDRLKIYGEDGKVVFDGEIDPDFKAGWQPYYDGATNGQPCALGCWVHWTQKGWQPDDWAGLFMRDGFILKGEKESRKPLRAELVKRVAKPK